MYHTYLLFLVPFLLQAASLLAWFVGWICTTYLKLRNTKQRVNNDARDDVAAGFFLVSRKEEEERNITSDDDVPG